MSCEAKELDSAKESLLVSRATQNHDQKTGDQKHLPHGLAWAGPRLPCCHIANVWQSDPGWEAPRDPLFGYACGEWGYRALAGGLHSFFFFFLWINSKIVADLLKTTAIALPVEV